MRYLRSDAIWLKEFKPQMIFISAGLTATEDDMGGLKLLEKDLFER